MKSKNIISRKCIITQKVIEKSKLIRVVRLKNGSYEVDSNSPGRGAYVSRDKKNIEIIERKRPLNRAFRDNVDKKIYAQLIKILEEA
ncbi:MAG: YlxR family protein [Mycoplasmatales bacterium]|nr:YlxR family protein [Mycoplasmatales bacterium]